MLGNYRFVREGAVVKSYQDNPPLGRLQKIQPAILPRLRDADRILLC